MRLEQIDRKRLSIIGNMFSVKVAKPTKLLAISCDQMADGGLQITVPKSRNFKGLAESSRLRALYQHHTGWCLGLWCRHAPRIHHKLPVVLNNWAPRSVTRIRYAMRQHAKICCTVRFACLHVISFKKVVWSSATRWGSFKECAKRPCWLDPRLADCQAEQYHYNLCPLEQKAAVINSSMERPGVSMAAVYPSRTAGLLRSDHGCGFAWAHASWELYTYDISLF